jgi:hypothetical protein
VGLFSKKDKEHGTPAARVRLTDPAMLRRKGVLARGRILDIESKPSTGGSTADPAYQCVLSLEVLVGDEAPFEVRVQQRLARSALGLLAGDGVVAPVWVDLNDRSKVAVDVAAGAIDHAPTD